MTLTFTYDLDMRTRPRLLTKLRSKLIKSTRFVWKNYNNKNKTGSNFVKLCYRLIKVFVVSTRRVFVILLIMDARSA